MRGLKKLALVTAIAAAPIAAQAEMQALDDTMMGNVTGQAGVTIDINEAVVSVGEIAYEDRGFLVIDNLRLAGGERGEFLDKVRIHVDVAGTGLRDDIPTGTAGEFLYQESMLTNDTVPGRIEELTTNIQAVEIDPGLSDGDLVISLRTTDGFPVDFGLTIDSVSLARQQNSDGTANSNNIGNLRATNPDSTVLISDLSIQGNFGPIDIIVQEETDSMNINAYFNANGEVTMPFMGTSLKFSLHNTRGQAIGRLSKTLSFAHAQVDVSVAENYEFNGPGTGEEGKDALRVTIQDFSGDLDLTEITMGNGQSIGSVYMTDLAITADTVIYGH